MAHNVVTLRDDRGGEHEVAVEADGSVTVGGRCMSVLHARRGEVRIGERTVWVAADDDIRWVFLDGRVYVLEHHGDGAPVRESAAAASPRRKAKGGGEGGLSAPMPATVVKILAAPGDPVKAGDVLIILEAMKMELPVRAAADGVVKSVRCGAGDLVQPGEELIEIEPLAVRSGQAATRESLG